MLGKPKLIILCLSAVIVGYAFLGGMLEKVSARDDIYGQLSIFTEVLDKIRKDYVEQPDLAKAMSGALHGMMEALDPYSSFVDGSVYSALADREKMAASPGILLSKRHGYAYVVAVLPGSPAEEAGLRTGDLLESIEGEVTTQISLWEAQARLLGEEGSKVKVRLIRSRRDPAELEVDRRLPAKVEVSANFTEPGIGLLTIPEFEKDSAGQVSSRLKMLQASNLKGLLLDLRSNAEGELDEAIKAADLFVPKGKKIVSRQDRGAAPVDFASLSEPLVQGIPIVVLVDGGTSGPAEVFAAALTDNEIATIVGERTNGYGSTQKRFAIDDKSFLFISTGLLIRPDGKPIQEVNLREAGIGPDVRSPSQDFVSSFYFENTSEDLESSLVDEFYRKLDKAIEEEQMKVGLELIRKKVFEKAA